MAERTGGGVNADDLVRIEVDAHLRVRVVEGLELLGIVPAEIDEHGSVSYTRVTLTEDKTVSVLPLGVLDVESHVLVIENGKHIHDAHAAADMTAARPVSGVEAKSAQLVSLLFER